jgi:hypothetical protein
LLFEGFPWFCALVHWRLYRHHYDTAVTREFQPFEVLAASSIYCASESSIIRSYKCGRIQRINRVGNKDRCIEYGKLHEGCLNLWFLPLYFRKKLSRLGILTRMLCIKYFLNIYHRFLQFLYRNSRRAR